MQRETGWEHFEHGADIGVRGYGETMAEAFSQGARALTAVITDLESVAAVESVHVSCSAPDDELLFTDWLNAIVYEMAVRNMLFSRFEVNIKDHALTASLWGEAVNLLKHRPVVEVKGATYTALKVVQDEQGRWVAQCVVDV